MLTGLLDRITRNFQLPTFEVAPTGFSQPMDPALYTEADVLPAFKMLPAQSAFLGICEDGYPMLMQLDRPELGSVLLISDDSTGRTQLAHLMAVSAINANPASEFKFTVIYSDESAWEEMLSSANASAYLMAKADASTPKAVDWILQLALLAEDRSFGRRHGANLMVILDEADFLQEADGNVRSNFVWLCQYGPHFNIHPVISLSTEAALEMPEIIKHIRTRVYGRMPDRSSFQLSGFSGLESESFEPDHQFVVRNENNWIPFWTPRS